MRAGEIKRKRSGHFGSFFLGTLIGFLLTIALIVGAGAFIYFNVSAKWISTTFNANLSLGNEELDNLTLSKIVSHAMRLSQNIETYSLNDLKTDFGVDLKEVLKNAGINIDISDLESVPIKNLPQELPKKLTNISAQELNGIINLEGEGMSGLKTMLDKEKVYYYNETDEKLYNENGHTTLVDFEYELSEDKTQIIIKNFDPINIENDDENLENGKIVKIKLWFLPLSTAFSSISNITSDLKLQDLKDYGITLPAFLDKEKYLTKSLNELGDIIDGLKLYEVLGYKQDNQDAEIVYKDGDGNVVQLNAIVKKIIAYGVNELDSAFENVIKDIKVYEAMGYTQEFEDGAYKYYENVDGSKRPVAISKVLSLIIDKKVTEINSALEGLRVFDVFDRPTAEEGGIFALLEGENPLVTELPQAINKKLHGEGETRGATIDQLIEAKILPNDLANKKLAGQPIGDYTLDEFIQKLISSGILTSDNA